MFIIKLLGIGDLLTTLIIWLSPVLPQRYVLLAAMYLLGKGGIFAISGDFASYIDVFGGVYIILLAFGMGNFLLSVLFSVWLVQKAIFSLF